MPTEILLVVCVVVWHPRNRHTHDKTREVDFINPSVYHSSSNLGKLELLSAIHLSHHNIHAAEDHHHIRHGVAEAKIFQNSQINKTRRAHAITVRIRSTVADQIETEFALGRFDASISFAHRWTKGADLHLRVHDGTGENLFESLLQDSHALAHFERAHH